MHRHFKWEHITLIESFQIQAIKPVKLRKNKHNILMIEPFQQNFTVQELDSVFLNIVDYSKKKTKVIYGS